MCFVIMYISHIIKPYTLKVQLKVIYPVKHCLGSKISGKKFQRKEKSTIYQIPSKREMR